MASDEENSGSSEPFQNPAEIEELQEHVENEVTNLLFDPDDRKTVSLVVRGEDGEILGESYPRFRSGVYALVRVAKEPANPDEYRFDREDPPEWVEWVFQDPPLDHFVTAIRCRSCGESNDHVLQKTTNVVTSYEWESVRHKGTCEHASERDQEEWPARKRAREIRNRPHPRTMALSCLWDEIDDLRDVLRDRPTVGEAAEDRLATIGTQLESRLRPRYPDCPECGHNLRYYDGFVIRCGNSCDIDDAVLEEYRRENGRVWGRRGHGDRGRPKEGDDGE